MNTINKITGILSSWGNYFRIKAVSYWLTSLKIPDALTKIAYIPYGNGRSYGDCALNSTILHTTKFNQIISFDNKLGIIQCQAGILLADILEEIIPHKWFLPVTPGTKFITLGGAVAADVHGKNHHKEGCFSTYILNLELLLPSGEILQCSPQKNAALFRATCGGMGLTGVIISVTFKLKAIQSTLISQKTVLSNNLEATFAAFEKHSAATYTVAWIDGLTSKKQLGKSVLFIGEHDSQGNFNYSSKQSLNIPRYFPTFVLNPLSIKLYNFFYFKRQNKGIQKVPLNTFFYPLDAIKNWNRIYGKKGFIQYQVIIPKVNAYDGIYELLYKIQQSNHTPYLIVLKLMGKENDNYLSFPLEGYTIAIDFKMDKNLFSFLNQLDQITLSHNGRAYLAKDARMSQPFFEKGYSRLKLFKDIRTLHHLENLQSLQSKRLGI